MLEARAAHIVLTLLVPTRADGRRTEGAVTVAVAWLGSVHHARVPYVGSTGPFTLPDGRTCDRLWEAVTLLRAAAVAPLPCALRECSDAMDGAVQRGALFALPAAVLALLHAREANPLYEGSSPEVRSPTFPPDPRLPESACHACSAA